MSEMSLSTYNAKKKTFMKVRIVYKEYAKKRCRVYIFLFYASLLDLIPNSCYLKSIQGARHYAISKIHV